jgi:hypothetical protein
MVSTGLAAALALTSLTVAGVLGAGVGYLACVAFRRPWTIKNAVVDVVVAVVVTVIAGCAVGVIDRARGILEDRLTLILVIGVGSVVLRHVLSLARGSSR